MICPNCKHSWYNIIVPKESLYPGKVFPFTLDNMKDNCDDPNREIKKIRENENTRIKLLERFSDFELHLISRMEDSTNLTAQDKKEIYNRYFNILQILNQPKKGSKNG